MMKGIPFLEATTMLLFTIALQAAAQESLTQVHQDFSSDPGWEWKHNRIVAQDPPTVRQDFGWTAGKHTGAAEAGEIGGKIWQSRTPAYYAIPLNRPLSFKDKYSFSCRIAFMPTGGAGVAYLGFFNHERQGWRVWNSMAVRLGGESGGQAAFGADSMTAKWESSGGTEGYLHVPADGKPHTLRFSYDPQATPGDWPDPRLRNYVTGDRETADEILARARKDEPNLTKEELEKRLVKAHAAGLIQYLQRTGHESIIGTTAWNGRFWFTKGKDEDKNARKGAMTLEVDDSGPFKVFINKDADTAPVYMDRFGLFNLQMYHQYIDLYLSDLTVNGHKVDLSKDPAWDGQGNRVQFAEQDFQREDFGYSETNWAGDGIGEVGGSFTSAETIDPIFGYYADEIGKLTLDDPISFFGNVCFVNESTDSGMYIGYFNKNDLTADLANRVHKRKTVPNSLGILLEGSASGGKYFGPALTSIKDNFAAKKGLPIRPTRERHSFKFEYDPKANNNLGRITVTVDGKTSTVDLNQEQRSEGALLDHFGVANLRAGGKYVTAYFDDLTYTARRPQDYKPVFHRQEVIKVPFPEGGRKY